jgi:hypothetical protein
MKSPFSLQTLELSKDEAKNTIFAKGRNAIPMREHAPFQKVVGFIQAEMGISLQGNPRYDWMTTFKTELELIQKYRDLYSRKLFAYSTAHTLSKLKWGRTLPANNCSLNIMHRPTRHAFCKDKYVDLDMVNAQVSILCESLKNREDVDISALIEYNSNPKKYREDVAIHHGLDPVRDKDIAKQLFIRTLFGGSYSQWIKDFDIEKNIGVGQCHPLVVQIENQLGRVRELFYDANPQLVKDLKKHNPQKFKDLSQLKRTLLATALQTIERWIMESCVQFLVDEKKFALPDIVPCQDGFMILQGLSYPELREDIERVTAEKFGLNIKWVRKEFDEAIEIPDAVLNRTMEEWECLFTDSGLAKNIHKLHGKQIQYKRPVDKMRDFLYMFDSDKKRWYLEDSKSSITLRNMIGNMYPQLHQEIADDVALTPPERMTLESLARRYLLDSQAKTGIAREVVETAEWDGIDFDSVPYYLGFENGFMDLRTHTFEEYREDIHITITTGYDFIEPDYSKKEDYDAREILVGIFNGLFDTNEETVYLLQILASCLDAINYQYLWFFTGAGANGKGLCLNLLKSILGARFYCAASCGLLTADSDKVNQTSEDLCSLKNRRVIVFSEMNKTEGMTWGACKLFTGRETVSGRQLYQGIDSFDLQGSTIGSFNEKPEMIGSISGSEKESVERRLRVVRFPHLYKETDFQVAENPVVNRKGNKLFQNPEWQKSIRHVLFDLLCGVYSTYYSEETKELEFNVPDSVTLASASYIKNEDLFAQIFDDLYVRDSEKTEDCAVNRIWVTEIFDEIKRNELYQDGLNGKGRKAFARAWNRKTFREWAVKNIGVKYSTAKSMDYILGYTFKECVKDVDDIGEGEL